MVSFPQLGGCGCARVRYRLGAEPLTVYACHCTDCQTATGSSFALSMFVHRDAWSLVCGSPQRREFALPDGRVRRGRVCPECGTELSSETRVGDGLLNLRPGTLDDTSWARPVAHIWTRSAQPWVPLASDALRYAQGPDDPLSLVRAWQSRAGASSGSDVLS